MPDAAPVLVSSWTMSPLCLSVLQELRRHHSATVMELSWLLRSHPSRIRHEVVRLRRSQLVDVSEVRSNRAVILDREQLVITKHVASARRSQAYAITAFGGAAVEEARAA